MLSLNEQEKHAFLKLARSNDADILKTYIGKIISETTNVDNLTSDIVENAKAVKAILKEGLLDLLTETEVTQPDVDSWE